MYRATRRPHALASLLAGMALVLSACEGAPTGAPPDNGPGAQPDPDEVEVDEDFPPGDPTDLEEHADEGEVRVPGDGDEDADEGS